MSHSSESPYKSHSLAKWLDLAESGDVALPSFQRGYVWKNRKTTADYLMAVFANRPTGVFLLLSTNGQPHFSSRTLKDVGADTCHAASLVLDGQQRLTSLWNAFTNEGPVTYYVRVEDLSQMDVSIIRVESESNNSVRGRLLREPQNAYLANLVPLEILRDKGNGSSDLGPIWDWCMQALCDGDRPTTRRLEKAIKSLRKTLLCRRYLYYYELPAETDRKTAIDIFIQSNKSSVKVSPFDIAVALAEDKGGENLRARIAKFHEQSAVTSHYFRKGDNEAAISTLGEWLLFSACITEKGVAPKRQRFEQVIEEVFGNDREDPDQLLDSILNNLEWALSLLADHGGPTRQTLPAIPPLHVLAAIREHFASLSKAAHIGVANRLLSAYIWRSYFTARYESKANDNLFEDYKALRQCLVSIKSRGSFQRMEAPEIFSREYTLPNAKRLEDLVDPVPWIKGAARLGRAIGAIALCHTPKDWVTNDKLDVQKVREFEGEGNLHRHHVFPREVLKQCNFGKEAIYHGLNGVLLRKPTNLAFSKKDPRDYIQWILNQRPRTSRRDIESRLKSHLVPYRAIMGPGSVRQRYRNYIRVRAKLISRTIREVARLPADG